MSQEVRLTLDEVRELANNALLANGLSSEQARAIADNVTRAERDECKSHGLFRIPWYVGAVRAGTASPDAVPVLSELAPAVAKVDAGGGFSPLAQEAGADALTEKARAHGLAALAITRGFSRGRFMAGSRNSGGAWPGRFCVHRLNLFCCSRRWH